MCFLFFNFDKLKKNKTLLNLKKNVMKNYTLLATIALAFFLVSCTADEPQSNTETTTRRTQQFETTDLNSRESDSVVVTLAGDPLKPKGRD